MKKYYAEVLVTILLVLFVATGCDKINLQPTSTLNVKLTDSRSITQALNLDVKEVKFSLENNSEWRSLTPKAGVYNLSTLKSGQDTLIASGNVPATNIIKQLRLVFGENNTIQINKQTVPVTIASGTANSLDVLVGVKMNKNIETLTVDFDAATTLVETSDGKFELRPVLKVKAN
jgi:hypothetical protein